MDIHVLEVLLIVGRILLGGNAGHLGGREDTVGNQHGREELVLGTHPLELVGNLLLVVATLAGRLDVTILAGKLVADAAPALLKGLAKLMARDLLVPVKVHKVDVQGDNLCHILLYHLHAHHVAAGHEGIFQSPLGTTLELEVHQHGAVIDLLGFKEEVLGLKTLRVVAQGEAVFVITLVKEHHLRRVVGLVALERGAGNHTTLGAEFQLQ